MGLRLGLGLAAGLVLGAVCGFLKTNALLTLAPWAVAGMLVGLASRAWRLGLASGAVFGFAASFVYLLLGYNGSRPLISIAPFFVLASLFGAFCGACLGAGGALASSRLLNRRQT